jgi:integrase
MMTVHEPKKLEQIEAPQRTPKSKDGYSFDPASRRWQLNKDITVNLSFVTTLLEPARIGFLKTLQRYAEEMSACHTQNMATRFQRFVRDTGANTLSPANLLNWRSMLPGGEQWQLGGLKSFLLAWHDYGYEGASDEVADLLREWRLKGNEKGMAVASGCAETGPLTDVELNALLSWANMALVRQVLPFWIYAYFLTLAMTARRAVQIASLRGKALLEERRDDHTLFRLNVPRAKQRGGGFRKTFRSLVILEDLQNVLTCQHRQSVAEIEARIGQHLPPSLCTEVPIFLNPSVVRTIKRSASIEDLLNGNRPDLLHATTLNLQRGLVTFGRLSTARSERTGEYIRISATRFRYTRGTKLRREGFGPFIIAELLDHSDIQNVQVYTQNTAAEAVVINDLVGRQLAPFAQACMGTLVWSEREALRGEDSRSRVPNGHQNGVGTCGNYGFCASGYRACYTCYHFQPWVNGPHEEVLEELYEEKRRVRESGCAEGVVNATDLLILAVEHCVDLCQAARGTGRVDTSRSGGG